MIDFFALFAQPRQPWLDADVLKQQHHELTRRAHPDLHGGATSGRFEEINEAYRILSDPKQRIEHLVALENAPIPPRDQTLAADLQEYFLRIATLRQQVQHLFTEMGEISSAIKLSLVKNEFLQLQKQTQQLLEELNRSYDGCVSELRELNEVWKQNRNEAMASLHTLRDRMSYLARWLDQLKETELQLKLRG